MIDPLSKRNNFLIIYLIPFLLLRILYYSTEPDMIIGIIGMALCILREKTLGIFPYPPNIKPPTNRDRPPIMPRFINIQPLSSIREATSIATNRLMSVRGNVTRVSSSRPMIKHMIFTCGKCGNEMWTAFQYGKYDIPVRCEADNCRGGDYAPIYESALAVDRQSIRLQELESDITDAGRVPRTIEIELQDDLIDSCVPGDVITLAGVLRALENETAQGRGISRGGGYVYTTFIDAHSVTTHKIDEREVASYTGSNSNNISTNNLTRIEDSNVSSSFLAPQGYLKLFSERDRQLILRIKNHRDPLSLILASSVPSIIGNENVKLGLLLGLFGGSRRIIGHESTVAAPVENKSTFHDYMDENLPSTTSSNAVTVRRDPHILVVGDPGIGKSQMLKVMQALAPRGVYVSGQSASTAGLTAAVVVQKGTGDTTLEAGALVLSDQGVCAIDEFDKMKNEHHSLLEAMEQQRVSLAKAGVVSSLSARASVLAAANPVGGHYDRSKTISENLKLNPALLSRFDLVFIVLDNPDSLKDAQLTEHHFATLRGDHSISSSSSTGMNPSFNGQQRGPGQPSNRQFSPCTDERIDATTQQHHLLAARYAATQVTQLNTSFHNDDLGIGGNNDIYGNNTEGLNEPLELRLKRGVSMIQVQELLPPVALRKYLAYARHMCNPQLLPDAALELKDFYMKLRRKHGSEEGMPITTRQLESLIRLAEARAKIELADYVTIQHVRDVINLMMASIYDAAQVDDLGTMDFTRVTSGMSNSKALKALAGHLRKIITQGNNHDIFTKAELLEIIERIGLPKASSTTAKDLFENALTANILGQRGSFYKFTG